MALERNAFIIRKGLTKNELGQNIRVLEDVLSNNLDPAEAQEVLAQIKTSFKSMYPPRGGLSEFFIWREDYEERLKANG